MVAGIVDADVYVLDSEMGADVNVLVVEVSAVENDDDVMVEDLTVELALVEIVHKPS